MVGLVGSLGVPMLKGKDVRFNKNCLDKVIVVCWEAPRCEYKVY